MPQQLSFDFTDKPEQPKRKLRPLTDAELTAAVRFNARNGWEAVKAALLAAAEDDAA